MAHHLLFYGHHDGVSPFSDPRKWTFSIFFRGMSVELLEAVLYYQINGIFRKENWLLRDPNIRLKALVRKGGGQQSHFVLVLNNLQRPTLIINDLYIDRAVKKYTSSVPLTHLLGMSNSRTSKNWLFHVISTKNGGVESAIWLHHVTPNRF